MDPFSATASVIAIYQLTTYVGGALINYGQGAKNAKDESRHVMDEIYEFQQSLRSTKEILDAEAMETIENGTQNRLPNLSIVMANCSTLSRDFRSGLESLRTKLETEIKRAEEGRKRDVVKSMFRTLTWPLEKQEVQDFLETLRNVRSIINSARGLDEMQFLRSLDTKTKGIDIRTTEINERTKQMEIMARETDKSRLQEKTRKETMEIREKIQTWLKHVDPSESHRIASEARTAETGYWFLHGEDFQNFKTGESHLVWLFGSPGCGKTILAASIIDEIQALRSEDSYISIAYWYFESGEKLKTNFEQCVRSLITQSLPSEILPEALIKFWKAKNKGVEVPKLKDLILTLSKMISDQRHEHISSY